MSFGTWPASKVVGVRHPIPFLTVVAAAVLLCPAVSAQERLSAAPGARWAPVEPGAVAVVAFENISVTPSDDWLGDGIAETLSADFEGLDRVSVVGREGLAAEAEALGEGMASFAAGDTERWLREVSRRRGAAWLVTGGYQRFGERLRITARLVHTGTGAVAAGVKADGDASEIFALQDRIGEELAGALVSSLTHADGAPAHTSRASRPPDVAGGYVEGNGNGNGYVSGNGNGNGMLPPRRMPAAAAVPPSPPRPALVETDVNGEIALGGAPMTAGFGVAEGVGILTGRPTMRPPRTRERPRVDGRLDDAVWRDALHITDFVQQNPVEGAPATEATDVWIAYDSQNFYLAVHAHYADPSLMRANRNDRDQAFEDDNIAIYFDTFLDQNRAYRFRRQRLRRAGRCRRQRAGVQPQGARPAGPEATPCPVTRSPPATRPGTRCSTAAGRSSDDGFTAEAGDTVQEPALPGAGPGHPAPLGLPDRARGARQGREPGPGRR